jgi:DUF4097 and DUF4098 domain-containing protein YvlB
MKLTRNPLFAVKVATSFAALFALATLAPRAFAEEFSKVYSVTGRAQVRVDTNDGSVRIAIDTRQDGDNVEINARVTGHWGFSFGGNHRNVRIEVRMPKDADLQVDTGDGAVETQPINGRVKIHTGDGSVKAQAVSGNVDIDTGDGSITVEGAKGEIRLHTGDGHIDARNLDGRVDANSGDGHIKIDGRLDALNVKTGDGSIDARIEPGSKLVGGWSIHTGDGSVDMVLPPDLQANIDASTNDGHISLGIPVTVEGTFSNSQIHGKMNGGGQSLTIHTGDGSIRLSKSS